MAVAGVRSSYTVGFFEGAQRWSAHDVDYVLKYQSKASGSAWLIWTEFCPLRFLPIVALTLHVNEPSFSTWHRDDANVPLQRTTARVKFVASHIRDFQPNNEKPGRGLLGPKNSWKRRMSSLLELCDVMCWDSFGFARNGGGKSCLFCSSGQVPKLSGSPAPSTLDQRPVL